MNLTKRLRVEPGSKVKLADIDPAFHGKHETEKEAKAKNSFLKKCEKGA